MILELILIVFLSPTNSEYFEEAKKTLFNLIEKGPKLGNWDGRQYRNNNKK
jgi:hypothetical protein